MGLSRTMNYLVGFWNALLQRVSVLFSSKKRSHDRNIIFYEDNVYSYRLYLCFKRVVKVKIKNNMEFRYLGNRFEMYRIIGRDNV